MPKLPRVWNHFSSNILDTRDSVLYVGPTIAPGKTVARVFLRWRIMGYWNESEFYDLFDAYYVGVRVVDIFATIPANTAWGQRNVVNWMWWEGAHFTPVFGVGTPGRAHLTYPRGSDTIDIETQRLIRASEFPNGASVVFCFARSGGVALSSQRVNVVGGVLLLG